MANPLTAFLTIVNNYQMNVQQITHGNNRANNMGEGLEGFIKDAFANTFNETDEQTKLETFSSVYSYSGNKNNPPDLILQNSDAIEIKKLESRNTAIALNSSYPKAKLFANSTMITTTCRACETWVEKDMLYAIGNVPKNTNQLKYYAYHGTINKILMIDYNTTRSENSIYFTDKSILERAIADIGEDVLINEYFVEC